MQKELKMDPHNNILKITYRRYRNHCNKLIKKLKRQYNHEQLSKYEKNPKQLWKSIKNITNFNENKNREPIEMKSTPEGIN